MTIASQSSSVKTYVPAPEPPPEKARKPGRVGVQLHEVLQAADDLVARGLKPTIERVRQHLHGGSPNTISPMLDEWFARLAVRLAAPPDGPGAQAAAHDAAHPGRLVDPADDVPLGVAEAARRLWRVALAHATQVHNAQIQADHRVLALEREALAAREAEQQRREAAFEDKKTDLANALASSHRALAAMEAKHEAQLHDAARGLAEAQADVRALRKALATAEATTAAVRETATAELASAKRTAKDAEERHIAQERRLLAEVDRAREEAKRANHAAAQAATRDQAALTKAAEQLAGVREQLTEEIRLARADTAAAKSETSAVRAAALGAQGLADKHLAFRSNELTQARAELDHASTRLQEIRALHEREMTAHEATRHLLQNAMAAPTTGAAPKGKLDPASPTRSTRKRDGV
ncbi:DNA-binding protein [Pararhizobium sp.]|uniref:DNA-binding protein n=1 Tax=Pararhizobium sp. TaxID=1977563 RepID=UPI00271F7D3D|nr:DNA-binding protein [Pararhizobium sp.]MDO9415484.1 DNA-binding protein [Pararhizobium sp.]